MINNDQELKKALAGLSIAEQRELGAQFVASVSSLNPDPLIERALKTASDKKYSDSDLNEIYLRIKSLSIKTYTSCGDDADWSAQAAHFIASAAKVCLTPEKQLDNNNNLAWKCAMQARMAKNCAMIESDEELVDNEAQKQYIISNNYLSN